MTKHQSIELLLIRMLLQEGLTSDNYFREVDSPGDYKIAEPLQDFTSYAIFIDRTGDQPKKYLKKNNEF